MKIKISRLTKKQISIQVIKEINCLLEQLFQKTKPQPLSVKKLKEKLGQHNLCVYIATDRGKIVGMASIYFKKLLDKEVGWIDDVVVQNDYRKQGIGDHLIKPLLREAKKNKVGFIELTTGYHRKEAFRLYQKFGFKQRKTRLMRLMMK